MKEKVFINIEDLQDNIIDLLSSDELNKILENLDHGDDPVFKNGFIAGLAWAGCLVVRCPQIYYIVAEEE